MKKSLAVILLALLVLTAAGCGAGSSDAAHEETPQPDSEMAIFCERYYATPMTPDIVTFRAEVLEVERFRHENALMRVSSLTEDLFHWYGVEFYIMNNDFVVLLDANGEPIAYSEIPAGATVEITYHGWRNPGIIRSAISVQVVV